MLGLVAPEPGDAPPRTTPRFQRLVDWLSGEVDRHWNRRTEHRCHPALSAAVVSGGGDVRLADALFSPGRGFIPPGAATGDADDVRALSVGS